MAVAGLLKLFLVRQEQLLYSYKSVKQCAHSDMYDFASYWPVSPSHQLLPG